MSKVFKNVMVTYTFGATMTRIGASNLSIGKLGDEDYEAARQELAESLAEFMDVYSKNMTGRHRESFLDAATDIDVPSDAEAYCEDCGYSNVPNDARFCPGCGKELES